MISAIALITDLNECDLMTFSMGGSNWYCKNHLPESLVALH
jgi:hypothetical protein